MVAPERGDRRDAVARRLDAMREEKNLSLTELAALAGIKVGVLSALHTGRRKGRNMKLGVAAQICQALDKKVGRDLLGEDDIPLPMPAGMDLTQISQSEKDALLIHLLGALQRGLQIPPVLAPRSEDDPKT
jgi:DNA-binding Xre family transcriptional regulator